MESIIIGASVVIDKIYTLNKRFDSSKPPSATTFKDDESTTDSLRFKNLTPFRAVYKMHGKTENRDF